MTKRRKNLGTLDAGNVSNRGGRGKGDERLRHDEGNRGDGGGSSRNCKTESTFGTHFPSVAVTRIGPVFPISPV